MLVGLMDKMRGVFGKEEEEERPMKESGADFFVDEEGATWENPRWEEEREEREEARSEDFREKAEERDRMQQEYEDLLRQAKEEQTRQRTKSAYKEYGEDIGSDDEAPKSKEKVETERERIVRERRERIEDLQQEGQIYGLRQKFAPETEQQRQSRERRERIEELRQTGAISGLESKYTRTGQLKSQLKGAARETFLGKKKTTDRGERVGRTGAADRATKAIRGVATLGGAVHTSKARKHLYTPKVDLDYYIPGKKRVARGSTELYTAPGMRELHVPKPASAMQTGTLRRASTPSYERMRQASTFKPRQTALQSTTSSLARAATGASTYLAKPMGFVKVGSQAQDVAMERLRGLSFPTGLTNTEKLAYAEIKANHDIDTKSHVVSELMDLGIDKMEALRAVEGLMQRRVVKRGQTFAGEPALEIA